jgi:C1A family cysteine protease
MKAISLNGCCSENLWPYKIQDFTKIPTTECKKAGLTHTKSFKYMSVNQNLGSIKNALAQGFPIIFGISVYDSFENNLVSGNIPIPNTLSENFLGGHAILLVAYNDVSRLFTFMNSYGLGTVDNPIGDKGFFTIPYDYVLNKDLSSDFWICTGFE